MKKWRKYYIDLMLRTRHIGVIVAVVIVLLAISDIWKTYDFVLQANIKVYDPELQYNLTKTFTADIIVGLIFAARSIALLYAKKLPYFLLSVLYLLCIIALASDIWVDMPYSPYAHCSGNGICFAIYDMSAGPSLLNVAGYMFFLGSFVRIAVTSIVAMFQLKNNELNSYS